MVKSGRPRNAGAERAILQAALDLVSVSGYRNVTVDAIAARAGVSKMTVYRRWLHKAALVMDALLTLVGPGTDFPVAERAMDSLRLQLDLQAKFFRGPHGLLIRSLVAEAQTDADLARAFREGWIVPRREGVVWVLQSAIEQGDLRKDLDVEVAVDALYGPIYYRLLIGTGKINRAFVDDLFEAFLRGHKRRKQD